MPHVVIHRLVIYPPAPFLDTPDPTRALEVSIDGVTVVINLPLDLPLTKPRVKAFLLSILPEIHTAYDINLSLQPTHNMNINQEFDFQWP